MKKLVLLVMFIMLNASNIQNLQNRCENGNISACWLVGYCYESGKCRVKQDYLKAKEYYEKGCKLNDGAGCFSLGNLYYNGNGVKKDYLKAKQYYKKACDLGSQNGCKNYVILLSKERY